MPSLDEQVVTLEVPTQLAAIPGIEALAVSVEAIMNVGSDMTPEQREQMRERMQQMTPEQRQQMMQRRQGFNSAPTAPAVPAPPAAPAAPTSD